jgi:hypothetical protein
VRARPLHLELQGGGSGGAAAVAVQPWCRWRALAPAGGQHGDAPVRRGRVTDREARHPRTAVVEEAAPRPRCRDGPDPETGQIVAAALTDRDVDDASQVGPLLNQVTCELTAFTADGGYDQGSTYDEVARRHPDAAVVVPSGTAETEPTRRDRNLQCIAEHGCMGNTGAWAGGSAQATTRALGLRRPSQDGSK